VSRSADLLTQRLLALLLLGLVGWLLLVPLARMVVTSPDTALIQVLNGLAYSLLIFLIATGFSLIFGMMDVINLAHGSLLHAGRLLRLQHRRPHGR
jgi:hypothetical protein